VKPSILQYARGFFREVSVARENVQTTHDDLFIFDEFHLDSANRGANVARLDRHARVIQSADSSGFGKPIRLQHGDSEHQEELLRLRSERRGTADQRAKVRAEALANLSKDERAAKGKPERIERAATPDVFPLPGGAGLCE